MKSRHAGIQADNQLSIVDSGQAQREPESSLLL